MRSCSSTGRVERDLDTLANFEIRLKVLILTVQPSISIYC